jgi:hypothetical protein
VILSNGVSSPVFTANDQNDQGLQSFAIPDYSVVKRVKGTQQGGEGSYWLSKLSFGKKDGTEITKVEVDNNKPYGPDFVLDDSEEIIGIYGNQK